MPTIVPVTDREFAKAADVFEAAEARHEMVCQSAPSDEAALASSIRDAEARAVIVWVDRYEGELYDALLEDYDLPVLQDTEEDDVFGLWEGMGYDAFVVAREGHIEWTINDTRPVRDYNGFVGVLNT